MTPDQVKLELYRQALADIYEFVSDHADITDSGQANDCLRVMGMVPHSIAKPIEDAALAAARERARQRGDERARIWTGTEEGA